MNFRYSIQRVNYVPWFKKNLEYSTGEIVGKIAGER